MSIVDLVEYEDDDGDYVAAWLDTDDNTVVLQYNFVHFTLAPESFRGLADALPKAREALDEELSDS
jgi:hypothetical protein